MGTTLAFVTWVAGGILAVKGFQFMSSSSIRPYLRHLLLSRSEWMEERVYERAAQNGYGDITAAMSRLYAHLGGGPRPLSDLARRLAISRQAVHKMAKEGVRQGYVELTESPTDARIKLLGFTEKGQAMAASARETMEDIEVRLRTQLGTEQVDMIKRILSEPWTQDEALSRQARRERNARITPPTPGPTQD